MTCCFILTCRRERIASIKRKDVQPSPATAPQTPASACPSSASKKSSEQQAAPEQNAPTSPAAPTPDAPVPSKPLTISNDTRKETGDAGKASGAEEESQLRELNLYVLRRATMREFAASDASDAIGM